ncbi:MAG TPA: methyltransferase domain-containing protein [Bryobacteraceae bacterium]|jgi:SAM-dependent methyltransferase|nr:methyltransferase domain-containing protein [Bryobacteraceae bacterium]
MSQSNKGLAVEQAVTRRYSAAAKDVEQNLCCPTAYDPQLLAAIPEEVLARDYGCGDPTRHLRCGETVLDLGSGSGKICFLASQVVGSSGHVIGVDMNNDMHAVARRNAPIVAERIGYANVEFKKAKIQDLALDLEELENWLHEHPVRDLTSLAELEGFEGELRRACPLIGDESVDAVISSCVLNLVRTEDKQKLFSEIYRVLRHGGRTVISDIVSDEDIPLHLKADPAWWSGCISGALREDLLLSAFEQAGFYGISILERQQEPWRTVEGIEFRSITVAGYKGKEGRCYDQKHAVIYRGPFRQVEDDDGHVLPRGVRTAVCEKTYRIYSAEPYRSHFELVPPRVLIPLEEAPVFPCGKGVLRRDPRDTKGYDYRITTEAVTTCCGPNNDSNGGCC